MGCGLQILRDGENIKMKKIHIRKGRGGERGRWETAAKQKKDVMRFEKYILWFGSDLGVSVANEQKWMSFAVTMPMQPTDTINITTCRISLYFESDVSPLGGNASKLKFTLAANPPTASAAASPTTSPQSYPNF